MPNPAVQRAKRRQALGIAVFLLALALATHGVYRFVHADAIAFRHGENALARKDYAAAVTAYTEARASGMNSGRLDQHLSTALLQTGRPEEALAILLPRLQTSSALDAELLALASGAAQQLGRPQDVLPFYARFGPPERLPLADLVRLADLHQQAGQLDEAITCADLALRRAPDSADLHVLRGQYLANAGRFAEAIADFRAALTRDAANRTAQIGLARSLAWSRHYPDAITTYRAYLRE